MREKLLVPAGPVDLSAYDPRSKRGFPGDGKSDAPKLMDELGSRIRERQMMLFAQGRRGDTRRVLLVLQGMDTSGKGGVIRHAVALVDPQGLDITTFGAPTKKELRYDFLWRIRRNVPAPGMVGVFDRSHYEDVLVAKVRSLVPKKEIEGRYAAINAFESELAEQGVIVVKCFLHIDREVQRERLLARLDDPTKHWKYDPGDLDDRAHWDDYIAAYQEAIERCNDPAAPWYVVPAARKWYRNWAVASLLLEHLDALDLSWPEADFDVDEQRRLLLDSDEVPVTSAQAGSGTSSTAPTA
jgi:PPK2 family polyphosphate:nucleotide phosphotransferase